MITVLLEILSNVIPAGAPLRGCSLRIVVCLGGAVLSGGAPATAGPTAPSPEEGKAETVRYVVLQGGHEEGHHTVCRGSGGKVRVEYTWKHNGHGPELREEYTLAADGTYSRYQVRGLSAWEAPVDESFVLAGTRGEWRSTIDSGEGAVGDGALYWPLGGTPDRYSVAIAALARRPERVLPLLPDGRLASHSLDELEVTRGSESRRVELLELRGLGLAPTLVWSTAGDEPRLFALLEPGWLQVIEEGWQEDLPRLIDRQAAAAARRQAELARELAHPLPGVAVIRGARVFDSETATLGPPNDVYLYRGRISAVMPAGSPARDVDHVIDAAGRVLLPGLFDMHVHLDPEDGPLHLAAGVTTVRDMGNDNQRLQELVEEAESGRLLAPHVIPVGLIEGESRFTWRAGIVVDTLDEAEAAVDWYAQRGYRQIKLYNSFPREILRETAAHAHARGLRVSGHVPAFLRGHEAVEQGYDELQHVIFLMLNFVATPEIDTRTLQRFYLPAEKAADLDLDSERVRSFVELLASRKVVVDPTLAAFDFLRQRPGELSQAHAAIADHLPPDVRRGLRVADMDIPDDATAERYGASYRRMIELVGRLHRAGVPLVAGSDWTPGFTLHRELELYVEAGLSPPEALRVATWNGAEWAGVLAERGSVTPGKLADLILVNEDPTTDISAIRQVSLVLKEGVAYDPSQIYESLGIRPFTETVRIRPVR